MNMERRAALLCRIQNLEGLLAYAVAHGEQEEENRIRAQLARIVEELQ